MSFSKVIKQEVAYNDLKDCCAKAELSALIQLTSSLAINNQKLTLIVKSENPTTVKRVAFLLKAIHPVESELYTYQKTNLKKNNIYQLTLLTDPIALLTFLGLYSENGLLNYPKYQIIAKDCCARAYLGGAFLAYGSCNSPSNPNYHLEIAVQDEMLANFIAKLMKRFDLNPKITTRRKKVIVYLKKADDISDFLRCIGAHESLMDFENRRINRDFKNSLVRLNNCELANDMKSLSAAKEQIGDIELIKDKGHFERLNDKLKTVAELRLAYPEASLQELCEAYQKRYGEKLSRSGINHRMNKLRQIAKGYQ